MKRKLLTRDAHVIRAATQSLADYDIDTLVQMVSSLVRRGKVMERKDKARTKYFHLLQELERLELLLLPKDLESFVYAENRQGLTQKLSEISLTAHRPAIEVLYVQPLASGSDAVIDFECFARHVARHPDPLSQRFSQSLLRWRSPAGTSDAQAEIARGISAEPQ